jgi:hypothetical protein
MELVLCKITARRTKEGLVTVKREIIGPAGEDPEALLDRAAGILAEWYFAGKGVVERSGRRPGAAGGCVSGL